MQKYCAGSSPSRTVGGAAQQGGAAGSTQRSGRMVGRTHRGLGKPQTTQTTSWPHLASFLPPPQLMRPHQPVGSQVSVTQPCATQHPKGYKHPMSRDGRWVCWGARTELPENHTSPLWMPARSSISQCEGSARRAHAGCPRVGLRSQRARGALVGDTE